MLLGLDHLVVAVPDLGAATSSFAGLGFTVVPGGRHPQGTHNALIPFRDGAYLELFAFYEANRQHRWWEALQQGGGLVDFCMRTSDLGSDLAAFRRAGVAMDDPRPLGRVRPDGVSLAWRLAIPQGPWVGVVPFLIEDVTPREERVPGDTAHAIGALGVDTLTVAVANLGPVRQAYGGVLAGAGEEIEQPELGARGLRLSVGPHRVEFLCPSPGEGPLGDALGGRPARPWAVRLRAASPRGWLPAAQTHGARIRLG